MVGVVFVEVGQVLQEVAIQFGEELGRCLHSQRCAHLLHFALHSLFGIDYWYSYVAVGRAKLIVVIHHDLDLSNGIGNLILLCFTISCEKDARQVSGGNEARIVEIDLRVVIPTVLADFILQTTNDRRFVSSQ